MHLSQSQEIKSKDLYEGCTKLILVDILLMVFIMFQIWDNLKSNMGRATPNWFKKFNAEKDEFTEVKNSSGNVRRLSICTLCQHFIYL